MGRPRPVGAAGLDLPPPRPVLWPLRPIESAQVADEVLGDGRRRITIRHAVLEGVTPEMLAWWYGHVDGLMVYAGATLPRYLVWHPLDHISYEVLRPGLDGMVGIGSRIRVREAFQRDPRNLLDVTIDVERIDPDAAVVRRMVAGRPILRLVNAFEAVDRGTRYVSRMEIGTDMPVGRLGMNAIVRGRILPGRKGQAWARHHVEEIGNLEHFLPALFEAETAS
jgi:DAPG hydrolase PhiG domain